MKTRYAGFTLIELMIVIVIVALLAALALPSYTKWIRKGHRGEAQATLINWANNLEIFRAGNNGYDAAGAPGAPTDVDGRYVYTIAAGTNNFTLTATAQAVGGQNTDEERGTSCTTLTLNQSNTKSPAVCWQQ